MNACVQRGRRKEKKGEKHTTQKICQQLKREKTWGSVGMVKEDPFFLGPYMMNIITTAIVPSPTSATWLLYRKRMLTCTPASFRFSHVSGTHRINANCPWPKVGRRNALDDVVRRMHPSSKPHTQHSPTPAPTPQDIPTHDKTLTSGQSRCLSMFSSPAAAAMAVATMLPIITVVRVPIIIIIVRRPQAPSFHPRP